MNTQNTSTAETAPASLTLTPVQLCADAVERLVGFFAPEGHVTLHDAEYGELEEGIDLVALATASWTKNGYTQTVKVHAWRDGDAFLFEASHTDDNPELDAPVSYATRTRAIEAAGALIGIVFGALTASWGGQPAHLPLLDNGGSL